MALATGLAALSTTKSVAFEVFSWTSHIKSAISFFPVAKRMDSATTAVPTVVEALIVPLAIPPATSTAKSAVFLKNLNMIHSSCGYFSVRFL
ncbi:MAG TPA: hypothetical protein VF721_04055 [Pyrinomonadaceae bacterium]